MFRYGSENGRFALLGFRDTARKRFGACSKYISIHVRHISFGRSNHQTLFSDTGMDALDRDIVWKILKLNGRHVCGLFTFMSGTRSRHVIRHVLDFAWPRY